MPVNDVYQFTIIGEMQGQPVHNVFNYQIITETGPEVVASDFPTAWQGGTPPLQVLWLLNFSGVYTIQAYRVQRLYNGDTSQLKSLQPFQQIVNEPGTLGGDPPPSLSTVIAFYNTLLGPGEIFFDGKKFMSAGNELTLQDGQIDSPLDVTLADFYAELTLPLDLGSGKVAQFGVWSLERAQILDPTVFLPVATVQIRLNTGALQRRKRGTSTGGFQP